MPPPSEAAAIPLPGADDDLGAAPASAVSQLPWQSIPRFTPGTTNVQDYTRKLRFLASMWPPEHLHLLAPRAALLAEGSAFTLVSRLDGAKLRVNSQDGVALLVKTIGGQWGSTELEERFEYFEKALYGTTQKNDEANDSYISRMEGFFSELISRGTTMEEVQAYVLLRQSTLSSEDKKKVLMEHGGKLEYQPVVKTLRLIGSRFFHELQTGKPATKTKVYDTMVTEEDDPQSMEGAEKTIFLAHQEDDELEYEFVDSLLAQDDHDAYLVSSFEAEFEEFCQEVPGMQSALISYVEARQRLLDKRKTRGFWPPGGTSGKSSGKKGFKGKGKGKGSRSNLMTRIARSSCRICGERGHWKAECPKRPGGADGQASNSAAAAANVVMPEYTPGIDIHEKEIFTDADFEACSAERFTVSVEIGRNSHSTQGHLMFKNNHNVSRLRQHIQRFATHRVTRAHKFSQGLWSKRERTCFKTKHMTAKSQPLPKTNHKWGSEKQHVPRTINSSVPMETIPDHLVMIADTEKSTQAILDTGASRCIIGSEVLSKLLNRMPDEILRSLKERPSKIKFRFGNNQTLTSQKRIHFPLQSQSHERVWLGVEVVNGLTPFLFSKRAFKQLGGILDTNTDQCTLRRLQKTIQLETNATGLYLIDIVEFCTDPLQHAHKTDCFVGHTYHVGDNTCHVGKQTFSFKATRSFCAQDPISKTSGEHGQDPLIESCSVGPSANLPIHRDIPESSSHHGDLSSVGDSPEGSRQYDHGHIDVGAAAVRESDRNGKPSRCPRGADAPDLGPATGKDVFRAWPTKGPPSRNLRSTKDEDHWKPHWRRSASRPRRRLFSDQRTNDQSSIGASTQPGEPSCKRIGHTSTTGHCWNSIESSVHRGRSSRPKPNAGAFVATSRLWKPTIDFKEKHTGKTYFQTLSEDPQYLEWCRSR